MTGHVHSEGAALELQRTAACAAFTSKNRTATHCGHRHTSPFIRREQKERLNVSAVCYCSNRSAFTALSIRPTAPYCDLRQKTGSSSEEVPGLHAENHKAGESSSIQTII